MPNPLLSPLLRWLGTLRYPKLFLVLGGLFLVDLAIPNLVPWDDILLGVGTLLLANWKNRKSASSPAKPIDGESTRH